MKLSQLKTHLDSLSIPVAYNHFEEETQLPYITYLIEESSNFIADNITYANIQQIRIELYTKLKDLQTENKIEDLLETLEIPYETLEAYIDSEKCYQVVYFIELLIERE